MNGLPISLPSTGDLQGLLSLVTFLSQEGSAKILAEMLEVSRKVDEDRRAADQARREQVAEISMARDAQAQAVADLEEASKFNEKAADKLKKAQTAERAAEQFRIEAEAIAKGALDDIAKNKALMDEREASVKLREEEAAAVLRAASELQAKYEAKVRAMQGVISD